MQKTTKFQPGVSPALTARNRSSGAVSKLRNAGLNLLQVLCDLVDVVEKTNTMLTGHKHGVTPPSDNAAEFHQTQKLLLALSTDAAYY